MRNGGGRINLILNFIFDVALYFLGYWFLKAITFGRFKDSRGSLWVSFVGLAVFVLVGVLIFLVREY